MPKMIFEWDCKERSNFEQITETAKEIQNLSAIPAWSGIGCVDCFFTVSSDSGTGKSFFFLAILENEFYRYQCFDFGDGALSDVFELVA